MKGTIKSRKNFEFGDAPAIVLPTMVVKYRPKKSDGAEYAIIANKKTFPTAVERNRAKRLIRAWMNRCDRPDKSDVLFITRRKILETGLTGGVGQMAKAFGIIKKKGRTKTRRRPGPTAI